VLHPLRVGTVSPAITGRREGDRLVFALPSDAGAHWFLLAQPFFSK
jgi:hypothetical protein